MKMNILENLRRNLGPLSIVRLAAILVIFVPAALYAQGGPPMITDDTGTVPKGQWEINTAFTFETGADGDSFGVPLLDINYGISKNSQIKVEIPWLVLGRNGERRISGLGNTNIGVRYRFRDETEHKRVALSIYPQIEFNNPTSSVRRGVVDKGPEFLMPLQWETHVGKYGVNGDVGYRFKRGSDEVIYGVVVGRELTDSFQLLGEIHGTSPTHGFRESEVVYNIGSRVKLANHFTLLLSAGSSLWRGHDPRFIAYAGLQTTF
ncbi:MAG: hypothetical protein ABI791_02915 [Acidobacteriota bacterium]